MSVLCFLEGIELLLKRVGVKCPSVPLLGREEVVLSCCGGSTVQADP